MSHSDRGPVRLTCREPMDFDPLHLDVVPPKSQSTVDIRAAYSEIVPQALAAIGNLIADDHRYTSNEEGHLAWDVSLLVRAAVLSWRTTGRPEHLDRKSTRLNSSHVAISYAVFCLKKKTQ